MPNIISLLIKSEDQKILIGKHASGDSEGLYGIASSPCVDRRPQKTAGRLAEWSTLGVLGTRADLEFQSKPSGRTPTHIQMYTLTTQNNYLDHQIRGITSYLQKAFPVDAVGQSTIPSNIIPWSQVKWMTKEEALETRLDQISRDVIRSYIKL